MYDMYPWGDPADSASAEPGDPQPRHIPASRRIPAPRHIPPDESAAAIRAVQVALDRRDNGGDGVAAAGQATASATRQ